MINVYLKCDVQVRKLLFEIIEKYQETIPCSPESTESLLKVLSKVIKLFAFSLSLAAE